MRAELAAAWTARDSLARLLPPELHRDRRYDISGEIGQGGMGVVLDARDPALRRGVAMKVLLDQHAGDHLLRFIEEAQVTGQLEHPSIPPVHELGVDENGKPYYTMKRVRGQTLLAVLADVARSDAEAEEKYPLPALLTVFQKVCDAVAFAHEKRIHPPRSEAGEHHVRPLRRSAGDGLGRGQSAR